MSTRKAVSIGVVVLLHAIIGYAFITGLAYNVIKKVADETKIVDVKEAPPPPEVKPPPPPPDQKIEPPPMVTPPSIVQTVTQTPPMQAVTVAPPPAVVITPAAPVAPPPPPAPSVAKSAQLRGDQNFGITNDDYPPAAQRAEEQGSTGFVFDVGPDGRVTNCRVTSSSGSATLDAATCTLVTRRGRFTPAQDAAGNKITETGKRRSIRWVLPKD